MGKGGDSGVLVARGTAGGSTGCSTIVSPVDSLAGVGDGLNPVSDSTTIAVEGGMFTASAVGLGLAGTIVGQGGCEWSLKIDWQAVSHIKLVNRIQIPLRHNETQCFRHTTKVFNVTTDQLMKDDLELD